MLNVEEKKEEKTWLDKVNDNMFRFNHTLNESWPVTLEEAKKTKINLLENIQRAKYDKENYSVERILEEQRIKRRNAKEIKEAALKNYDKYLQDQIRELKRNASKDKLRIQKELKTWDEDTKKHLEEVKKNSEDFQKKIDQRLQESKEDLKTYKDIEVELEDEE